MPLAWLRCRTCGAGLFLDEGQRGTCGGCFRSAVLRLDHLLALAALKTPRPGALRHVTLPLDH